MRSCWSGRSGRPSTRHRRAGGRVVVVDAVDAAAKAFYEHHDFQPMPGSDQRLLMKLSTAATALGEPWP